MQWLSDCFVFFLSFIRIGIGINSSPKRRDRLWLGPSLLRFGKNMQFLVLYVDSMISFYDWVNHCYLENCYCIFGKNEKKNSWIAYSTRFKKKELLNILFICSEDSTMKYEDALLYASGILILNAINTILVNQFFILGFHNGMKVRVAVCSLIYRKVS